MKHITIDEIIDFVSFDKIDNRTLEMSRKVNGHIRNCEECIQKVRAFQAMYDEFVRSGKSGDFRKYVYDVISGNEPAAEEDKTAAEAVRRYSELQ